MLGGIVHGILVRGFQISEPAEGLAGWLPVGVRSIGMLMVGLVLLRFVRTSRLRTVAAAVAAAPATGGLVALEFFAVWAVSTCQATFQRRQAVPVCCRSSA
jgi:hypothetical protein